MKTVIAICVLAAFVGSASAAPIVVDNFNSYTNGSVVGQGGWQSYVNGNNFVIQSTAAYEGAKALYNNTAQDSVVGKMGDLLADGKQAVYVRTENRSLWSDSIVNGPAQVRMTKGLWASGYQSFTSVSFRKDGTVAHYDPVLDVYQNFATYSDNQWTLLETEWRSTDKTARYRVSGGAWTGWMPFAYNSVFSGFDFVGFDFDNRGGLGGGVYFDALGAGPPEPSGIPEPCTDVLLVLGAVMLLVHKLRKKQ